MMQIETHTYVAEINGEPIVAFRADDVDEAFAIAHDAEGGLQLDLTCALRVDGTDPRPVWDGESAISVRLATKAEHERWAKARDAEVREATDGKLIDLKMGDDWDDFNVYLIPISYDEDDEQEDETKDRVIGGGLMRGR
jgi:hypothetical protein